MDSSTDSTVAFGLVVDEIRDGLVGAQGGEEQVVDVAFDGDLAEHVHGGS